MKADSSHKEEKQPAAAQAKTADPAPPVSPETEKLSDQAKKLNEITENNSKSWGDRFKELAFGTGKHVVVNYAINTLVAATFAYTFERNLGSWYQKKVAGIIDSTKDFSKDKLALHKIQGTTAYKAVNYALSAVFLTAGGTLMLPFMKHGEENRQYYQYKLSKMLDKTQSMLGMSNEDTERNLADYKLVENIAVAKQSGKDSGVSQEEIERLEKKYHFAFQDNGNIEFDTVKITWGELLKARAFAIAASMATGAALGASKGKGATAQTVEELEKFERTTLENEAKGNFGDKNFGKLESWGIKPLADKLQKVPGLPGTLEALDINKHAAEHGAPVQHFAKLLFMDAILTVVSALTFGMVSGTKKENEPDKKVLDTNKDGWVTLEEKQAYKEAHKEADVSGVHVDNVIQSGHHAAKVGKAPKPDIYKHAQPKNGGGFGEQITSERQTAQDVPAHAIH